MQFKYKKPVVLGITILLIVSAALSLFGERTGILPVPKTATPTSVERLKIPSIGVDAAIERVALTPDGAMNTPKGPRDVGWYSLGPYPGQTGSAVIAGHRGWKDGIPAVFDGLDRVRKGDHILVIDAQGNNHTFVVRETRTYKRDSYAPEVFASSDGAHLNLITCVGPWNPALKSTEERLVVFSDLVS